MKITLNDVGSLIEATTAKNTINGNSATIENAWDNTLSRDGTSPNQMESDFDMNSHRIINLPEGVGNTEPVTVGTFNQTVQDLEDQIHLGNVPPGGNTGNVLTKDTPLDFAYSWHAPAAGTGTVSSVGLVLPADFTVTNSPVTTTGNLTGTFVNTPTGTGGFVRATSPTLVTPALGTPSAINLTNGTALPIGSTTGNIPVSRLNSGTGATSSTFWRGDASWATPAGGGTVTGPVSSTNTGFAVWNGTTGTVLADHAATVAIGSEVSGLGTGVATFLATPTSANLRTALTDEVGTGAAYFVGGALGTPASGVATNLTGTASGLTAGTVTTNANLTGAITSTGNATSLGSFNSAALLGALTDETGTGANVFATSPTLVTPLLGTPTSGVLTNCTGTASGLTAGNVTTNANLTGPITSTGNATAVTANAITNAMLAQMPTATLKGNATGGTATPTDLTGPQVSVLLSAPVLTAFGAGSGTYNTPAGTKYLVVEGVGAGGGGAGSGTSAGAGGNGSAATTFGAGLTGNVGTGGTTSSTNASGGTGVGGYLTLAGAAGGAGSNQVVVYGGAGGNSFYGCGGNPGFGGTAPSPGSANSGSGGGGAGDSSTGPCGGGGGAGGYFRHMITSPLSSYAWTVGNGGTGGTAGTGGVAGAAGGSGFMVVTAYTQ